MVPGTSPHGVSQEIRNQLTRLTEAVEKFGRNIVHEPAAK